MHELAVIRYLSGHLLDRVLPVLDRALHALPEGGLDFRPTPDNMSAAELGYHVYQVVYLLLRTAARGSYDVAYLDDLPFDPEAVRTPGDITDYGERVKRAARGFVDQIDAHVVARPVDEGPRRTPLAYVMLAVEEAIHHRGQLMTYLRLQGVQPPYLYDYVS
jgi:uncharacterized damage-inducible protein DinB